jgi:hypothetical protein
LREINT